MNDKIIKMVMKVIPKLVKTTVGAIIVKNNKILLERRSLFIEKNKWCLPGGHLEYGETAIEGLKREIKEELGVDTTEVKFMGYFDEIIPKAKNHSVVLIFKVKIKGEIKVDKNESFEVKWVSKKDINKLNFAFKHKDIINKFFTNKQ